ncbi:MAG: AgmX/PglI C-terminal domain-containing protein [Deltaproteobacteria bacterium]|nr:AgmX/PglI C-terminal domain-containing protein [Deltaproteobacteria bacterium]
MDNNAAAAVVDGRLIELVLRWQGRVVDVKRLLPRSISIGGRANDTLALPIEGGSHELMTSSGELRLPPGARVLSAQGSELTFGLGLHSVEVRRADRSRVVAVAAAFDAFWGNVVVVVTMGIAALVAALLLAPTGMDDLDDDLLANPTRYQTMLLKPKPVDNTFLNRLKAPAAQVAQATTTTTKPKKAAATTTKTASALPPHRSNTDVVNAKLGELFGREGIGQVMGADGGGVLALALEGLNADRRTASSSGALQLRDGMKAGGTGTLDGGPITTRGRGDGNLDYGAADGVLDGKPEREITVDQQPEVIIGSLDPAIIRRIVREHAGQVRYCYERELTRTVGLTGKITMKWTINSEGNVTTAGVAETTMKNKAVESCLAGRVATWKFPKPKGGGFVVVSYPFVLKQAG